ncbi:MAG: putative ral secretion pathway protein (Type traffic warden ATPase) [Deltaproteobacteria bacterium]|nr:putative ral secretion pathway protein (Type traffic warden ATPase) [Deltaproteobacteria bacterium]
MAEDIPRVDPEEFPKVPFVVESVSSRFIREHKIVPVDLENNVLKVIMAEPENASTIDALRVAVSGDVKVFAADPKAIEEYISKFYSQEGQNISRIIEDMSGTGIEFISEAEEDIGHLKDLASEAPIIKLVNLLITRAVESRASDIHVEPFADELKVRYRIDGVLHNIESMPRRLQPAIVSRIKIMAKLNIAERRLPQDGRIRLRIADREIDLRVSAIPIVHGESIVMRILDKEGIVIDLDQIGFARDTLSSFQHLITMLNGIVLVTGPTGSGKLRHIVRQDPDIILIGEIRDLETAEIAIQSALTGHLVFSTLHTNDAPSSITRLLDMGVENFLLSSTVRGILAQRLVRVICPECKEIDPEKRSAEHLALLGVDANVPLYRGGGCEKCTFTGYYGRNGIFELLIITDEIQKLILKSADSNQITQAARAQGMRSLLQDGVLQVLAGATTLNEVLRVTQES